MQLGLTIPLQKHLKLPAPPYGAPCDLFFCWELHRIVLQSRETLVAVNANNRFAVVLCGMDAFAWKDYTQEFLDGLKMAMLSEGYTQQETEQYLHAAGPIEITKTHGRRSVAGLNLMDNALWSLPICVMEAQRYQPIHCHEVNRQPCRMAGYEGYQVPAVCFEQDMERNKLVDELAKGKAMEKILRNCCI